MLTIHQRLMSRLAKFDGINSRQAGFTLIELVVTMAIAGVLATIGMFGFANWQATSQHKGTAEELVSQLRNTAERAISEGRTYCVDIAADGLSYAVWQKECGAAGSRVAGPSRTQSAKVTVAASFPGGLPAPTPACPAGNSCLYFYPRGTAIEASLVVASSARSKLYTVHVEGLTSRVWM